MLTNSKLNQLGKPFVPTKKKNPIQKPNLDTNPCFNKNTVNHITLLSNDFKTNLNILDSKYLNVNSNIKNREKGWILILFQ